MIRVTLTGPVEDMSLRVAVSACVLLCERMEGDLPKETETSVRGGRELQDALGSLLSGPLHVSLPGVEVEFKYEGLTVLVRTYSDGIELVRAFMEAEEKNRSLGEDEEPCLFIGP